jgi:hypothetical protein
MLVFRQKFIAAISNLYDMKSLFFAFFILSFCLTNGQNPLKISTDFPGGNIIVNKISEDTVWLQPDLSFTEGPWFYWYFKASGISGKRVFFKFDQENMFAKYGPAYSLNNDDTWKWYGEKRITGNGFTFTFSEQDTVAYFSVAFPYTEKDLRWFLSTLSDKTNLNTDTLCITHGERAVEKIILSASENQPKFKVLITARHHACEMMASYVLEGLIESILNEKNLEFLRQNVEFLIIPFVDKDGVENGDQGKNRRPRDHNRDYDGESVYASTSALREIVPVWGEEKVVVALDLHCPWLFGSNNEDIYIAGNAEPEIEKNQIIFSKLLEKYSYGEIKSYHRHFIPFGTSWNTAANYTKGKSFGSWAGTLDGIKFAGTIEFPYANVSGIMVSKDGARAYGKTVAYSICDFIQNIENQ